MVRIVRVGARSGKTNWHEALKDLRADDMLFLEPGFYDLPQGITLTDITIKGTGSSPEDTTIMGYVSVSEDSRYVTLENLCINTNTEHNSVFVPTNADSYLTLRNCVIKGTGTDTAAVAANGKVTLELYSTTIMNGSLSMFAASDFKLEMNDSVVNYKSDQYCAFALEGKGTAIVNNSTIHGSTNTFHTTNIEFNANNSTFDYLLLNGQTWINMLKCRVLSKEDSCFYLSENCWGNISGSTFAGGVYIDKQAKAIIQNCEINRLIAVNNADVSIISSQIAAHADFQDSTKTYASRVSFSGNMQYEYYLAVSGQAQFEGQDLILNANGSKLAVQDDASFKVSVVASDQANLEIESNKKPNVKIFGMNWTVKKK